MSDHIAQAIETLEHEIDALEQRRGELLRAIDSLRPLAGGTTGTKRPAKAGRRSKKAAKRNERTNERTNERAKRGPTRPPRSLPDVTKQDAILEALRAAASPLSPSELAKALKIPRTRLPYQLKPLLKSGAVVATGATMNRQLSLPARSRAKEAP